MGLFDKKYCDICGEKIGMLGNRKLDDGNLCKECAKKLSPWFEERRHSTVEAIKKQLAYREKNKEAVSRFQVTRDIATDNYHVFIDDTKRKFAIAKSMNVESNPDIVDLSQVTNCMLDVKEHRTEEKYKDNEGKMKSFVPPRYRYTYDYQMKIGINSEWFDDMDFSLNSLSVDGNDRQRMMQYENTGNQIVAALTGQGGMMNQSMYSQPMNGMAGGMANQSMYGQPMNGMQGDMVNQGMYSQPMNGMQGGMANQGMYSQPMNGMQGGMANQGMYGQPMNGMQGGMANQSMYGQPMNGMQSGMSGDMANNGMYAQQGRVIRCDKCGWTATDMSQIPAFCPYCGDPIDQNDM